MTRLLIRILAASFLLFVASAHAERIEFDSPLYESPDNSSGARGWPALLANFGSDSRTRSVRVPATLSFPENAKGPVPALIIGHTSGGVSNDVTSLESTMRGAGFATLYYDSNQARAFGDTRVSGGPKLEINQVADAYMGLRALAADSRIDPKRIYYAGMSAGGNTALLAASDWIRTRFAENLRFAGLVALYPGGYALPAAEGLAKDVPILVLHAELDDMMKWSRTQVWVDYVTRVNPSVQIKVVMVKDAHHSFMNPTSLNGFSPQTPSPRCGYFLATQTQPASLLQIDGTIDNKLFGPSCIARGATTRYSDRASAFAIVQMLAFMKGEKP